MREGLRALFTVSGTDDVGIKLIFSKSTQKIRKILKRKTKIY